MAYPAHHASNATAPAPGANARHASAVRRRPDHRRRVHGERAAMTRARAGESAGSSASRCACHIRSPPSPRRSSVTVASAANGRNASSGNHAGQSPRSTPATPSSAAMKPAGTAPTSPMKMRAGGRFTARNGTAAAASATAATRSGGSASAPSAICAETDQRHRTGEPVAAIHEIVEIGRPREHERTSTSISGYAPPATPGSALPGMRSSHAAAHRPASACAARRTSTGAPRASSQQRHADQCHERGEPPGKATGKIGATPAAPAAKPAHNARPPTRGTGARMQRAVVRRSVGQPPREQQQRATTTPLAASDSTAATAPIHACEARGAATSRGIPVRRQAKVPAKGVPAGQLIR